MSQNNNFKYELHLLIFTFMPCMVILRCYLHKIFDILRLLLWNSENFLFFQENLMHHLAASSASVTTWFHQSSLQYAEPSTKCYNFAYKHHTRHGYVMGRRFYKISSDKKNPDKWIFALKRAQNKKKPHKRWDAKGNHWRVCSDHFLGSI